MTQTAVEWLKGMLEWNYGDPQMLEITWENLDDLLERAKQMEKEQMKGMYVEGGFAQMRYFDGKEFITGEQYYNETYGGQGSPDTSPNTQNK